MLDTTACTLRTRAVCCWLPARQLPRTPFAFATGMLMLQNTVFEICRVRFGICVGIIIFDIVEFVYVASELRVVSKCIFLNYTLSMTIRDGRWPQHVQQVSPDDCTNSKRQYFNLLTSRLLLRLPWFLQRSSVRGCCLKASIIWSTVDVSWLLCNVARDVWNC